jgi:hypothetical protein
MIENSGSQSISNNESFLSKLVPLVVPGGWCVQRNLLVKDLLDMEESLSAQWDWLFSAINVDGNLEVEVLGTKKPIGLCLSGALISLSSKKVPSARQLLELNIEPVTSLEEIATLVKSLFERAYQS